MPLTVSCYLSLKLCCSMCHAVTSHVKPLPVSCCAIHCAMPCHSLCHVIKASSYAAQIELLNVSCSYVSCYATPCFMLFFSLSHALPLTVPCTHASSHPTHCVMRARLIQCHTLSHALMSHVMPLTVSCSLWPCALHELLAGLASGHCWDLPHPAAGSCPRAACGCAVPVAMQQRICTRAAVTLCSMCYCALCGHLAHKDFCWQLSASRMRVRSACGDAAEEEHTSG
eukprot:361296-Pelagomonas_calceolata.AAC.3